MSCTTSTTSRDALMWSRLCSSSTTAIAKVDLWVSSSTSNMLFWLSGKLIGRLLLPEGGVYSREVSKVLQESLM